jgi:hypothetical protein
MQSLLELVTPIRPQLEEQELSEVLSSYGGSLSSPAVLGLRWHYIVGNMQLLCRAARTDYYPNISTDPNKVTVTPFTSSHVPNLL